MMNVMCSIEKEIETDVNNKKRKNHNDSKY